MDIYYCEILMFCKTLVISWCCCFSLQLYDGILFTHSKRGLVEHERNGHYYNTTNVMRFSFDLLRMQSLYMFRALLAHHVEALDSQ
jgi:hypothetical protein